MGKRERESEKINDDVASDNITRRWEAWDARRRKEKLFSYCLKKKKERTNINGFRSLIISVSLANTFSAYEKKYHFDKHWTQHTNFACATHTLKDKTRFAPLRSFHFVVGSFMRLLFYGLLKNVYTQKPRMLGLNIILFKAQMFFCPNETFQFLFSKFI